MPQRIPCGLHLYAITDYFSPSDLCLSASHAGCIPLCFTDVKQSQLCLSASHAGCIIAALLVRFFRDTLPQRIPCGLHRDCGYTVKPGSGLCLSASHAGCIRSRYRSALRLESLPQRIPCGLHRRGELSRGKEHKSLPQRIPCGLHHTLTGDAQENKAFASAHPMRVASLTL